MKKTLFTLLISFSFGFMTHNVQAQSYYKNYQKGLEAIEAKNWTLAIGFLESALGNVADDKARKKVPGERFLVAYFPNRELGVAYLGLNNKQKAREFLEKSYRSEPTDRAIDYLNRIDPQILKDINTPRTAAQPEPAAEKIEEAAAAEPDLRAVAVVQADEQVVEKGKSAEVKITLTNHGKGAAYQVKLEVGVSENGVIAKQQSAQKEWATLAPGASATVVCRLLADATFRGDELTFKMVISEGSGKFGSNSFLKIPITKSQKQPILARFEANSIMVQGLNNDVVLYKSSPSIIYNIKNESNEPIKNLRVLLDQTNPNVKGLKFSPQNSVAIIPPQQTFTGEIPIQVLPQELTTGKTGFRLRLQTATGKHYDSTTVEVSTRAFAPPAVLAELMAPFNKVQRGKPFGFKFIIKNSGEGVAENVRWEIKLPPGVAMLSGSPSGDLRMIAANRATGEFAVTLVAEAVYGAANIPVVVAISESLAKYGQTKTFTLDLQQETNLAKNTPPPPPPSNPAPVVVATASKPVLSWLSATSASANSPDYELKLCLLNDFETYKILQNNRVVYENAFQASNTRGFKTTNNLCAGYLIGYNAALTEGTNTFQVLVQSKAGEVSSTTATIKLNKPEKRIALVIGNANYPNGNQLRNPVNDATDMAKALERIGFEVIKSTDAGKESMMAAVNTFGEKLEQEKYKVALFYYAGHGMQVGGKNYLIPVDAQPKSEVNVKTSCVSVSDNILGVMESSDEGRANVIILDACRDNPFAKNVTRGSQGRGLAQIEAQGTYMALAAEPGKTALDGEDNARNGIFTEEILRALESEGEVEIHSLFVKVRGSVFNRTKRGQTPMSYDGLTDQVFIKK